MKLTLELSVGGPPPPPGRPPPVPSQEIGSNRIVKIIVVLFPYFPFLAVEIES